MKIFDAASVKQIDAITIAQEPVLSVDLMERAARACYLWMKKRLQARQTISVFCGMGNNGGDGLALARMLAAGNHRLKVYQIMHAENASEDFLLNQKRLKGIRNIAFTKLSEADALPDIGEKELVIDAIFGSGLNRPAEGLVAKIIDHVNASGAKVIAIDIPSGLFCEDNRENNMSHIIHADYTLSFQFPKLSFLFAENEEYVGQWFVLDIGLHPGAIQETESRYHWVTAGDVRQHFRPRSRFAHKGHFGHALLLAGSKGKTGAALLAAHACIRSGSGLTSAYIPGCGYHAFQSRLPEVMCLTDENEERLSQLPKLDAYNAIAAGPGMGTHDDTARMLKLLIQEAPCPLILDADALNILAENPTWLDFLPPGSVLTPHPKEFDRLAGKATSGYERLLNAREMGRRFHLYIVLKGAYTSVVCPDGNVWFNSTGNPGMASGGSGDVLTGILLGWMAQNYTSLQASLIAVYLHGLAGDLAAKRKGQTGMIASDIIEMLPGATKSLSPE
jgi:ADP-dependent NAD(P)H-hydrate dehydratase / NAD(P)H-hydrate epimerase